MHGMHLTNHNQITKKKKGESLNLINNNNTTDCKNINDDNTEIKKYTISCQIFDKQNKIPLDVEVLIDTGALQGNYVNKQIASVLCNNGLKIINNNKKICSAINNVECSDSLGSINFTITYVNEINKNMKL